MTSTTQVRGQDDRVTLATRALAALIVPFLVAAFINLYVLPGEAARVFAWPIAPRMTEFLLASAYLGGAYFFVRVALARRWHDVQVGFLPVTTFASLMLIATLLHWSRFSRGHLSFLLWVALYASTPFLVLGAWLLNRPADPRAPDRDDVDTPMEARAVTGTAGLLLLAAGVLFFVLPGLLIGVWPWPLTPLTARVVSSCFALTGVFGLVITTDRRWSAARIAFQSQAFAIALILFGAWRAWSDFDPAKPVRWLFVGGLGAMLSAIVLLYVELERQWRGNNRPSHLGQAT
jgi:hypothetical protein